MAWCVTVRYVRSDTGDFENGRIGLEGAAAKTIPNLGESTDGVVAYAVNVHLRDVVSEMNAFEFGDT